MIFIQHTCDFEMFSSNRQSAMQGNGYLFHKDNNLSGPRLLRFYDVKNFKVHDIKLVDAPAFHFTLDHCANGEVYNMLIAAATTAVLMASMSSATISGFTTYSPCPSLSDESSHTNNFQIMVTNKDECVTTKSPSTNLLIENIYCN